MDERSSKLEALRIERPAARAPGRGWRWGVLGGVGVLAVGVGASMFLSADSGLPVHAAIAKASSAGGVVGGGGSVLDASGYVVARRQASVSAKAIYKVVAVPVEEGQRVAEGQVLATLDDFNTKAALDQAKAVVKQAAANLAAARVAAADAKPIFERNQRQLAAGLISGESFEGTKASYDAAVAAVDVAQGNLDTAQQGLEVAQRYEDDTVIRAPFAGVITNVSAQPGQLVSTQFASGGGIATIVDMASLEVQVDVSESFINRVEAGQQAVITLNAYPDWHIPGEVIAIIPTADQAKATVKVRVAFKEKNSRVLPQMGASVSFLTAGKQSGPVAAPVSLSVIVPPEAVQGSGDTGTVYLISGTIVQRHAVKLGARNADGQTILSGLKSGDRVAVGDLDKLSDGVKVHILNSAAYAA